jgi:hypothetical protein
MNAQLVILTSLAIFFLASPLIFLITEVRSKPALRVAAGVIVAGSYFILLWVAAPFLFSMVLLYVGGMNDFPTLKDSVINQDQPFYGILFPKGSTVSTLNGKLQGIIPSKETEIGGIPAGQGTYVSFSLDGRVLSVTTGRAWIYQGISVPAGSTVYPNAQFKKQVPHATSGISEIRLSQPPNAVTHVEDMQVYGGAALRFDGDTLTNVYGDYEWNGEYFKSYRVGVDGQIQRVRELDERRLHVLNPASR